MNEFAMSGSAIRVGQENFSPGTAVPVINWNANTPGCLDPQKPNRRHGFCQIHIDEWDLELLSASEDVNDYLVADVTYATEGRGGEFSVGLTRGTVLAVGGTDVISIKAYFQSNRFEEELLVGMAKRVQATITWPGQINPKEAKFSLPGVLAQNLDGEAIATAWFRIPRQAESMLVQTDVPTALPALVAEFSDTDVAGASVLWRTLNPNANGTIIESGIEFVRFTSTTLMRVTPIFSIWP